MGPFSAHEVLAPQDGFVWAGRAGRVIVGSDRYVDGRGAMDWKLLGVIRVAHADGPDVSRSAAGRLAGEAAWVPTSLLPRFGVEWSAVDPHHVTASYGLHATQLDIRYTLDDDARVLAVVFDRWGDPRNEGAWAYHPFGFEVTAYSTFDGVTIPSSGRAGWFYGTDRWSEGEFFRSEITGYELVAGPPT